MVSGTILILLPLQYYVIGPRFGVIVGSRERGSVSMFVGY